VPSLRIKFQKSSCLRHEHSSWNGSHGNTLPEVNCNWYLPSEILHVIFTTIHKNN
jgi:hypothetical protein